MIEWMAALNLYRYSELFKVHNITGTQLMSLDDAKLRVSVQLANLRFDHLIGLCTKKSLFPVQRVAVIVASREAAIFFFSFFVCLVGKFCPFLEKKKCLQSQLFETPGRSTGNRFFFRLA